MPADFLGKIMIVKNLDIYQGDTCVFDLEISNQDGSLPDLSGSRLVMSVVPDSVAAGASK